MLKRIAVAVAGLLVASSLANAAIHVSFEPSPTVDLPGFTTTKVTLISDDPNEIIFGVDARFEGPLNQVNPLGMATPFQDLNGFFGQVDVSQDSQFLFHSNDLSPPALGVAESDTLLAAAFTNLPVATGGDGLVVPLAQIVVPNAGCPNPVYALSIDLRDAAGNQVGNPTLTSSTYCPEPGGCCMVLMALFGVIGFRRRRSFA